MASPRFDDIPEAPSTPRFDDIPEAPPQGAPASKMVAPVDPYAATGGTSGAPEAPQVAPSSNTQENISDALSTVTPLGGLQQIEKHVIDPALKWTQKNVGAPALDAALSAQKTLGIGDILPGQEYLSRASGSLLAGPEQLEKFGGTVAGAKNVEELTSKFGEIPTAVGASALKLMGDLPVFLINGPKSGVAILDHAAAGALIGLADPEMTMAEGAMAGAVLHGAAKGLSKAASFMAKGAKRVIGVVDQAFVNNFADKSAGFNLEFGAPAVKGPRALDPSVRLGPLGEDRAALSKSWGKTEQPSTALKTMHDLVHNPENIKVVMHKVSDLGNSVNPMFATTGVEDGQLVTRFQEPGPNGVVKRVDMPMKTNADFVKLRGMLDRDLDTTQYTVTPEAENMMSPEARRAVNRGGIHVDDPSVSGPGDNSYFLTSNGDKLELHEIDSTEGKIAALDHRGGLVALDTPEGTKYGRAMTDEGDKGVGVFPFEPHEGLPTFGGVHNPKTLRNKIPPEELKRVLEEGVTPPPPPPPDAPEAMPPAPPPGPPPPPEAALTERIAAMDKKLPFWTRVGRQLVGAHLRAPMDLAGYISDQQSVKNLNAGWTMINSALEKRAGVGATQAFREDVGKLFEGKKTFQEFEREAETNPAHKEAWTQIREMMRQAVEKRDANQRWLAERGYVPDETWSQTEGDAVNGYATQEYLAHFLKPGQRLKMVQQDEALLRKSVDGYQAWAKQKGKELSSDEALKKIIESLGTDDPGAVLFGDSASGSSNAPTGKLNYKKDLPDWYKNMLGPIQDGFMKTSRTLATQDALIANFKVYEGIAADPRWAQDKEIAGVTEKWTRFPDNKRLYGAMAGKLAPPEVYDALYTIPNIKNEINKLVAVPLGIVKTNQVSLGSFRTFLNMTMDNLAGGVLSGGLDMTKPIEFARNIKYAAKAMQEVSSVKALGGKANPLANNEFAQFIRDARRIGVDAPGHIGATLSSEQARLVKQAYAEIAGVKGEGSSMFAKFYELHQRMGAKGSMVVDGIDRIQKLASWKILTDKFMADGMDRESAMRAGARRIFQSYPMYDRVGLLTDKMRTSALGVVSPYSTFAMERNRILGSLPGRILDSVSNGASEDPGLKFRLLKYAALGAALYGANGVFRRTFGNVSDAEVDLAMNRRSGSGTDKFSPNIATWVAPFHDGRGKVAVVDMTQWLGVLSYLQGDPKLAPLANIAINIIKQPLSGGVLGGVVDTGLKQFGINSGVDARPIPPGSGVGRGVAVAADMLAAGGAAPRGLMDLYDNVKKTGAVGDIGKNRDTLTGTQAALRTAGIPFEQGVTQHGKQIQFQKMKSDARALLYHANKLPDDAAHGVFQKIYEELMKHTHLGDSEVESMRKEAHDRLKERAKSQQQNQKAQRAAKGKFQ